MMTKHLLEPQPETQVKKIWRRWKWVGLLVFGGVLLAARWLPGLIVFLGYVYGIVVIANLLFHGFRYLRNRLFWRVRNRLIGAFVFVGVIPLILLSGIAALSGYLLMGQLAGRYLEVSLQEVQRQLASLTREMAARLPADPTRTALAELAGRVQADHKGQFSSVSARLLRRSADGKFDLIATSDPQPDKVPGGPDSQNTWLQGETSYEGLLKKDKTAWLASLQPVPGSPGNYLLVSTPLDRVIEERMAREKSIYFSLLGSGSTSVKVGAGSVQLTVDEDEVKKVEKAESDVVDLQKRSSGDSRRKVAWWLVLNGREQETGGKDAVGMAVLQVPLSVVYANSVGAGDIQNRILVTMIYVLGGMFVFVELVSLVIGFTISRRITRSVHDMYQGILALQRGELQHQIPVRRPDQLGLLAHSFNHMSASIKRLLEEVSEKKRLEQELEIAREVQATLFPKQLPHPRGMMIFGGCEPARVVSGDYYDFIVEDPARLDIVVADISGKGISAALLMANLQAAMRNQLLAVKNNSPEEIGKSLALVMSHLNDQILANSPAEKYATLFLGRYDAEARRLWYCNAGHLPPILLDGENTRFLEATGMVIGLLPNARYEVGCVDLNPGSLLAIFTDGLTEAVNGEGEEFGDQRLLSALQEARMNSPEGVYKSVVEKIRAWQGNLPQHDDITLIVAKAG